MHKKDFQLLELIAEHCKDIMEMSVRFGNTKSDFKNDKYYQYAACMCILQIGENVNQLSDDSKNILQNINIKSLKTMRNIFAHNYGIMNVDMTWNTITKVIPILYKECRNALSSEYAYKNVTKEECDAITKAGVLITIKSDNNLYAIRFHKDDEEKINNILKSSPPQYKPKL